MMEALFFLQTQEIKQADGYRWEELYSSEQHPQNLGWHMMAVHQGLGCRLDSSIALFFMISQS